MKERLLGDIRRGSILLLVLATLCGLSLVVSTFLEHVEQEVLYQIQRQTPFDLELETQSYLDISLAVLSEFKRFDKNACLFSPEQGWGDPLAYAKLSQRPDLEIEIKIIDETGKLAFSKQNLPYFREFIPGVVKDWSSGQKIQEALEAILNDKPINLKRATAYQTVNEKLPTKALINLENLKLSEDIFNTFVTPKGWNDEHWATFKAEFTPVSYGEININTVSPALRQKIAQKQGWDAKDLEAFFKQEDSFHMGNIKRYFSNASELQKRGFKVNPQVPIGYRCEVLTISITLKRGEQFSQQNFFQHTNSL